jgi:uncharacterized membrane protein YhaH (DUF805 family)
MDQAQADRMLAQQEAMAQGLGAMMVVFALVGLAYGVFHVITMWKIYEKAGQPGWAALVPIYNAIVLFQVAGKPGWWILLMLIPVVNLVIVIMVMIGLAEAFGKSGAFAAGLILLGVVFFPILAFGDARYQGAPAAA